MFCSKLFPQHTQFYYTHGQTESGILQYSLLISSAPHNIIRIVEVGGEYSWFSVYSCCTGKIDLWLTDWLCFSWNDSILWLDHPWWRSTLGHAIHQNVVIRVITDIITLLQIILQQPQAPSSLHLQVSTLTLRILASDWLAAGNMNTQIRNWWSRSKPITVNIQCNIEHPLIF